MLYTALFENPIGERKIFASKDAKNKFCLSVYASKRGYKLINEIGVKEKTPLFRL